MSHSDSFDSRRKESPRSNRAEEPRAAEPSATVRVRVNGDDRAFPSGMPIAALLRALGVSTPRVAVERNRVIVPKSAYESTILEEGDEVEVVEFVGGG